MYFIMHVKLQLINTHNLIWGMDPKHVVIKKHEKGMASFDVFSHSRILTSCSKRILKFHFLFKNYST